MSDLQDFHHGTETRSKSARWIIGGLLILVLAGSGYYAWQAAAPPPGFKPVLDDSKLPSP